MILGIEIGGTKIQLGVGTGGAAILIDQRPQATVDSRLRTSVVTHRESSPSRLLNEAFKGSDAVVS